MPERIIVVRTVEWMAWMKFTRDRETGQIKLRNDVTGFEAKLDEEVVDISPMDTGRIKGDRSLYAFQAILHRDATPEEIAKYVADKEKNTEVVDAEVVTDDHKPAANGGRSSEGAKGKLIMPGDKN